MALHSALMKCHNEIVQHKEDILFSCVNKLQCKQKRAKSIKIVLTHSGDAIVASKISKRKVN